MAFDISGTHRILIFGMYVYMYDLYMPMYTKTLPIFPYQPLNIHTYVCVTIRQKFIPTA